MLRATTAFHAADRFIADGDELDAKDPIVKGREHLFEVVEDDSPAKPKRTAKKAAPT